jgi:hypothetical protein
LRSRYIVESAFTARIYLNLGSVRFSRSSEELAVLLHEPNLFIGGFE